MALSHTDLEMVTVRGVTFLVDPSTFVEGCTYLLVGSGTVEPFDSVPIPSAALLLNLGRGGSTPEERDRSLQVGDLLLSTMGQSQFVRDVPSISAYLPHLALPSVSSLLVLTDYFTFLYTTQSAHHHCLNVYLQLQILAALLKLPAVLHISCTHSAAESLNFNI